MKLLTQILVGVILSLLPFELVWIAYFASNRLFAPEDVFFSNIWWTLSITYYALLITVTIVIVLIIGLDYNKGIMK